MNHGPAAVPGSPAQPFPVRTPGSLLASTFPDLVARANATDRPYPAELTIPDLLDAAAWAHGTAPALRTAAGVALSHRELAEATRVQAAQLASVGVGPGVPVAVLVDHEPAGVQAIIAIVRAGGCYVPLDPRWPVARSVELLVSLGVTRLVAGQGLWRLGWEIAASVPGMNTVLSTPGYLRPAAAGVETAARPYAPSYHCTAEEVLAYIEHVAGLIPPSDGPVVEVGAGSGLLARRLTEQGRPVVAVDEIGGILDHAGNAQVVVLAGTVQDFPSIGYLADVLDTIADALPVGGSIVLADLIDPSSGQSPGSLRIPRRWWASKYVMARPGVGIHVRTRTGRTGLGPLAERYDVVLTVGPRPKSGPGLPRVPLTDQPRAWDALPRSAVAAPSPADPAYAITTSAESPTAVAIRHRSVVNLVDWFNRRHEVTHRDLILQFAGLTSDLSVYDLFGMLAAGGSVLLLPEVALAHADRVAEVLVRSGVTLWNSGPTAFTALLAALAARPLGDRSRMRRVFLSREPVPLTSFEEMRRQFPNAELVTLGGGPETCIWSNDFPVTRVDPAWTTVPYGRPIQNARYYVLRDDGTPCDVGEPGTLHIAGDCVAAAYLNDPVLTAARFRPDAWRPASTMFRTASRAAWTHHGWLELVGHQ
ncbi:AMP-binding protein [Catenulispora subtropica]|uniref:AMP-dependent synthetase/ligase domain-containing protein n=1 Tax=Catenulispora subtropica TaxID=450798 RepID=A0ABN2T1P4_9ACTN